METCISALKIGTDRGNYEGAERVPGAPDYPRWVGDSNLGIVRGVGSAVTRVQVGDRIVTRQAHQSEYITTDNASMVKVPANVADEDAVYAHLYALSAHCYHKAHFRPGENVAVIGLGTLGLGAVALGPLFGGRVVAIGNDAYRMDLARRMGAHATLLYNDPDLHAKLDEFTDGRRHRPGGADGQPLARLPHRGGDRAPQRPRLDRQPAGARRGGLSTSIRSPCSISTPKASR